MGFKSISHTLQIFRCRHQLTYNTRCNSIYAQYYSQYVSPTALRPKKAKAYNKNNVSYFQDLKVLRTVGGRGGNGSISFLQLWCNDRAGPDGGDGGNGGHVIFEASEDVRNLNHLSNIIQGDEGHCGSPKDCHGRSAKHTILKVPLGTIIRLQNGTIVGDLNKEGMMFVAARGGAGGKGNTFFTSNTQHTPKICEYGSSGEDLIYILELRSMADIGIIGYPNAGKSTLLYAISRAQPKIAPYPFTTLKPQIGVVQYADYLQLAIADLPGIIPDSHCNRGLGIQFLKHVERCTVLLFLIDMSDNFPWSQYNNLLYEMEKFNSKLIMYPRMVIANKIDIAEAKINLKKFQDIVSEPIIGISAKYGTNIPTLLQVMREIHEKYGKHIT